MKDFLNAFLQKKIEPSLVNIIQEYYSCPKHYKRYIFVEGEIDRKFYSKFLYKKISCNKNEVYFLICKKKESVILSENYFIRKDNYKIENMFFIVDRDYDLLMPYQNYNVKKVSMTKYYSVENYLFTETNIDKVLNYLCLQQYEKEIFTKNLNEFIIGSASYQALSSLKIKKGFVIPISFNLLTADSFYFNQYDIFFDEHFLRKIEEIEKKLVGKEIALYEEEVSKMKNNYLYMRGHDFELFFDKIMECFKINSSLRSLLEDDELIKKLEIELLLK